MRVFQGIPVSEGMAAAKAFLLDRPEIGIPFVGPVHAEAEIKRLVDAFESSILDLEVVCSKIKGTRGDKETGIIQAQIKLLRDEEWKKGICAEIASLQIPAETAVKTATENLANLFGRSGNPYMQERAADMRDIQGRLTAKLQGREYVSVQHLEHPTILVADELPPSVTIQLDKERVAGWVTVRGGATSHSAILARSLDIPAVSGLPEISGMIRDGDMVLLNGNDGTVIVNPTAEPIAAFERAAELHRAHKRQLLAQSAGPCATQDGVYIKIEANIGSAGEAETALAGGADGVGLFRSEFLFMNRTNPPTEEEQFQAYKTTVEHMRGLPVTIRTLDVGGDKEIPYLGFPKEMNPFLGIRAIRYSLKEPAIFRTQIRALLRASHYGILRIMLPMISCLEELLQAQEMVAEEKAVLDTQAIPYDRRIALGIMIETPAAALMADILAKNADFFSIGTNDLIQYTMACDRMNEGVAHLYQPLNPAVLRLIRQVVEAAQTQGIKVGMCGEMAADPAAVTILVGLGLRHFSMAVPSMLKIRAVIREIEFRAAQQTALKALGWST